MRRVAYVKFFLGSTIEEIEKKVAAHFKDTLCPGNVIKTNLYKLGGVYQYEVIYAQVVS